MRTLLAALFVSLPWFGCAAMGTSSKPLVALSDLDNAPFAWVDESGQARGRDVEMMEALAGSLGRELEWRRMPFNELLDALERGEGDVVCATLGITPQREARFDFTTPYFETAIAVVVRADGPADPLALGAGRVSAGLGTTSEYAARAELPEAVLVLEDKTGRTLTQRLVAGEVDAAVMDGPAADALVGAAEGALVRWSQDLAAERYALALRDGDRDLLARLDAALASMRESGAMARLDERHGLGSD